LGQIIQSALSEAFPLLMSRKIVYLVMAVVPLLAGFYLISLPPAVTINGGPQVYDPRLSTAIQSVFSWGGIAYWFVLPAVIRTVDPNFRMTAGRFFTILGLAIVVGIVCGIGMILVIPGIWIGIKWSQYVWCYAFGEQPNALSASWRITTGQFWETFGFSLLVSLVAFIPVLAAMLLAWISAASPYVSFVLLPIAFLIYVFALNFELLALMHWFFRLREVSSSAARTATASAF